MSTICDAAIHFCAVRLTRLQASGAPAAGPNNVYVSGNAVSLVITPNVEAGNENILKGGCGCISAANKDADLLKRFDLELDMSRMEAGFEELITGAQAILTGSGVNGVWFPTQLSCADAPPPLVGLEGWQDAWEDDHPDPVLPYIHWVFPATRWQRAAQTLQADFNQPKFTGYTRGNPNWQNPYGDLSEPAQPQGGWEYTATAPPTAVCGYLSHSFT